MSPETGSPAAPDSVQDAIAAMSTKEVLDCQDSGYDAGWEGHKVTTCPYRGPDLTDLARQNQWLRGYSLARAELRVTRTP